MFGPRAAYFPMSLWQGCNIITLSADIALPPQKQPKIGEDQQKTVKDACFKTNSFSFVSWIRRQKMTRLTRGSATGNKYIMTYMNGWNYASPKACSSRGRGEGCRWQLINTLTLTEWSLVPRFGSEQTCNSLPACNWAAGECGYEKNLFRCQQFSRTLFHWRVGRFGLGLGVLG